MSRGNSKVDNDNGPGAEKMKKAKAVHLIADMLFDFVPYGEICTHFVQTYGVSRSAVEKWIAAAKPITEERRQAATQVQRQQDEETLKDLAKKHNITLERVVLEYAKIAFADIRNVFDEEGALKKVKEWDDATAGAISSIETAEIEIDEKHVGHTRKLKIWNKKDGLDGLCKMFGYTLPKKEDDPPPDANFDNQPVTFK